MIDLKQFEGHTPGPWTWTSDSDDVWDRWLDAKSNVVLQWDMDLGFCFGEGDWSGPDARLIAAAPDLLSEVLRMREENARLRDTVRDHWDDDLCRLFAEGFDREDSAQRGEPNPWTLDDEGDIGDGANWQAERIACVRAGLRKILSG